jgi:TatA/E family protein of Tat protein translocase
MFGSLGVPELLLIFAVILIVFGPRRIPEIGRMLGKAMGEFRKATDDLKSTIEREVRLEELKKIAPTASEFTTPFEAVSRSEPSVIGVPEVFDYTAVDESSSLRVVEEQKHPEPSAADPLDDSTTRRLVDSDSERA